ncbi:MAG: sulfite exporter TauE/SafE family protein [Gemmatimonadetes bacterium]|nr:sulfite exporter TauE/SafE family protein [Gemmatimonadota bacterium]
MLALLAAASRLTAALQHRPLAALGILFGAGVLTSLNPCIYPMIPITIGAIGGGGAGGRSRARTAVLTLVYVSGLAMFYAILGLIAGLTGSLFGAIGASLWARLAIALLLVIFALAMLEVLPVRVPPRLAAWASGVRGGSVSGTFLLGATSGIVAAPCGAPAFAVVLTWVATTQSAVLGFLYLFVFSLGMTTLLVAVGLFSGTLAALPKAGSWMVWVKRGAGAVMLAMAGYYSWKAWEVR